MKNNWEITCSEKLVAWSQPASTNVFSLVSNILKLQTFKNQEISPKVQFSSFARKFGSDGKSWIYIL